MHRSLSAREGMHLRLLSFRTESFYAYMNNALVSLGLASPEGQSLNVIVTFVVRPAIVVENTLLHALQNCLAVARFRGSRSRRLRMALRNTPKRFISWGDMRPSSQGSSCPGPVN